jgi:hypothetical protein
VGELTRCNYCDLQYYKRRYGEDNIRVVPGTGEWTGWEIIEANNLTHWEPLAYALLITDSYAC